MKTTIRQRGGVWWLDQMVQGKRFRVSIGAGSRSWAVARAPQVLAEAMAKKERKARGKSAITVGDLREPWVKYCEQRSRVGDRTVYGCFNSWKNVFGEGTRLQALRAELVEDFRSAKLDEAEDELDEDRKERSACSMWNQARSVIQPRALDFYRRKLGLEIPDEVEELLKFRLPRAPAWQYVLPPDELVELTEAEGAKLEGDLRWIYRLAMNAGLRVGEMLHLRGSWVEWVGDVPVIAVVTREDFRPKGIDRRIPVPVGLGRDLEACGDEFVIGPALAWGPREDLFRYDFSQWMRGLGWDKKKYSKAAHELRKLYGSRIWSDPRLGPAVAQHNLGHASMQTTCRYYARLKAPLRALEER